MSFWNVFLGFLIHSSWGMLCFGPKITVPIPATSVQVCKLCSNVSKWLVFHKCLFGWVWTKRGLSLGTLYPVWKRPWLFQMVTYLLLSYTVGQRPQASHETWLAHPEWVGESFPCYWDSVCISWWPFLEDNYRAGQRNKVIQWTVFSSYLVNLLIFNLF